MSGEMPARDEGEDNKLDLQNETLRRIDEGGINQVRLIVVDLHGIPRAKTVTGRRFSEVMQSGHAWQLPLVAVDIWQNLPTETGYGEEVSFGNGKMVPDLRTFAQLPWSPDTAHVICDVYADDVACPTPRQVLSRVLEQANEMGYHVTFGNELEFYIYSDKDGDFSRVLGMDAWFSEQALGELHEFIDALYRDLDQLGIPVYEIFNEHGGGQLEINLEPDSGLGAIDNVITMKSAIKEIAYRHGYRATFMGKPSNDVEVPPSGYHLHQCLRDHDGANAFFDDDAEGGLTDIARQYIGGQLSHAMGLTGLAAPTITAYKRFRPGTWAPIRVAWGFDNRTAMVRVLGSGGNTRIENRLPSSCANPYLLSAGMVAAGLDGIRNGVDPGEPASHNALEDTRYPQVPTNFLDGIRAFAGDTDLGEALGQDFARAYVKVMELVWERFQTYVTDWEMQEYRSVL